MRELYHGGWVAKNIYYLGASGILDITKRTASGQIIKTLRIGGISGIGKEKSFLRGMHE